uniref:Ubiquitin-like domain-containing protein n=1 Tax=Phytophthora ramorum TaxID=164328 RepID=H3GEU8_PHYRM
MADTSTPPKHALTAAEKRAARRARVLQSSEDRLKLLKGQISSLKEPPIDRQLDEGVDELLTEASGPPEVSVAPTTELKIPPRVDPAQRRRDAATRRRRKEKMVQEMLGNKTEDTEGKTVYKVHGETTVSAVATTSGPSFSRHSTALKLHLMEEKLVLLLIVAAAVYAAFCMDLRSISASLAANDQLFVSYQDLIAKGVPMDSIRQQFEREQMEPEMREKLEHLLTQQLKMESMAQMITSGSGWFPDVADLGFFFSSLLAHPPIVLCVFLVRLLVSTGAKALHKALDLPDVKSPQEGDLGFLANLALSSRPVLKGRRFGSRLGSMESPKQSVLAKRRTMAKPETFTVFVATCQVVPEESNNSVGTSSGVPINVSTPVFKQEKFPAIVSSSAKMEDLQHFIASQWAISKSPFAKIPLDEHFYTFKGRILRLDGTLDGYYILNNDTIYLRFASLGKICDPWAMSTSELRVELKARNAYEINLQPEQLMQRLQNLVMKESRMRRLQQATRKEEVEQVQLITNELAMLHQQRTKKRDYLAPTEHPVERPPSLAKWPFAPCPNRTVFLSITELERTYQLVPRDVLKPALFIFDTERNWYMCFEQDFLEMLTLKEEAGMVFWFRVRALLLELHQSVYV